ncbi:MAG TPA: sigma-54 dependent transcriptional regulator [Micavibrio sp.]
MTADILIVDDEEDIRRLIQGILEDEGYSVRQAATAEQAYARIAECAPSLAILDIWLQQGDEDGLKILKRIKEDHPILPVLMISGHGTIETAVNAIKMGAYDFIEKPFKTDRLLLMIARALENAQLKRENMALRQKTDSPMALTGESQAIMSLHQMLDRVGPTNSRVLITGEPGTGKDLAARVIHKMSTRAAEPFMLLNCATLLPERLEIELFGSVDGIHGEPGKTGVLEQANGGTLLLDEVADMPLETQGKIVRVLQEQKFTRVGGKAPVQVDVRILASTNRDLQTEMHEGNFRQDLFYRLSVVPLRMPSLRERIDDIPALADYFLHQYAVQNGVPQRALSDGALAAMQAYDWPGNVRQLRNMIEWIMIMNAASPEPVQAMQLPPEIVGSRNMESSGKGLGPDLVLLPLREAREKFERDYLEAQVKRFQGNVSKTSQFVGMERSALHRKLKSLGISMAEKQNDGEDEHQKRTA